MTLWLGVMKMAKEAVLWKGCQLSAFFNRLFPAKNHPVWVPSVNFANVQARQCGHSAWP
jgi:spore maturation protein SpmA